MKYITAKTDLGEKATFQKYNGKFLEESDAQDLISVTEDTAIMKPVASLDGSDVPLAYVICNAFPNDNVRNGSDEEDIGEEVLLKWVFG